MSSLDDSDNRRGLPLRSSVPAADGLALAVYDWPAPASQALADATVLIVHGLGEHAGRYAALAEQLNAWGYAVRAYDQYGHGHTGGVRGALSHDWRLLEDLAVMVDHTRSQMPAKQPLLLLGHSMGGLVAALFVAQGRRLVEGLVLSSPALDAGLSPAKLLLVKALARVWPDLRAGNGLDVQALSHDAQVVAAYQADVLCHDRISARLAHFIATQGAAVQAQAGRWTVPSLLLWAGQDSLVSPGGSQTFANHAPADVVQSQCFAEAFHEIFNERQDLAAPVWARLQDWLGQRCAPPAD